MPIRFVTAPGSARSRGRFSPGLDAERHRRGARRWPVGRRGRRASRRIRPKPRGGPAVRPRCAPRLNRRPSIAWPGRTAGSCTGPNP